MKIFNNIFNIITFFYFFRYQNTKYYGINFQREENIFFSKSIQACSRFYFGTTIDIIGILIIKGYLVKEIF